MVTVVKVMAASSDMEGVHFKVKEGEPVYTEWSPSPDGKEVEMKSGGFSLYFDLKELTKALGIVGYAANVSRPHEKLEREGWGEAKG